MKKYNIITEIEGVKQYVRRIRRKRNGIIAITMYTTSQSKAFDFMTLWNATTSLSRMGIGKAIEVN